MRINLRLHGRTKDGQICRAEISIYPRDAADLQQEAQKASETAAWYFEAPPQDWVPDGSAITVERVEHLK